MPIQRVIQASLLGVRFNADEPPSRAERCASEVDGDSTGSTPRRTQNLRSWFMLALIGLLGLALRMNQYAGHWIWQDELTSLEQVYSNFYCSTADAPLYPWILRWLGIAFGGFSVDSLRLYSLVISLLAPIAGYVLTAQFAPRSTALIAALLLSVLEQYIATAVNIRPYSLLMIVTAASVAAYLRVVERQTAVSLGLLGALLTIAALTHLLALHLFLSIAITSGLLLALDHVSKRCPSGTALKHFGWLLLVLAVAGCIGGSWVLGRYHLFIADALQGTATLMEFGKLWFAGLPIGMGYAWYVVCGAWLMFLVGMLQLFRTHRTMFIFLTSLLLVSAVLSFRTLGERLSWDGTVGVVRYLAHLQILTTCIVVVGLQAMCQYVSSRTKLNRSLVWVFCLTILAATLQIGSRADERHVYRDVYYHFFQYAERQQVRGVILGDANIRTVKLVLLLRATFGGSHDLYSFDQQALAYQHPVTEFDLQLRPEQVTEATMSPGPYLSNVSCETVESNVRASWPSFAFREVRQLRSKLMSQRLYLCQRPHE